MNTLELERTGTRLLRWTVKEYDRLSLMGAFRNKRVELICGRIMEMAPQLEPHVAGISLAAKALDRAFGDGYWVRRQSPLQLEARSKPEPDVAVVSGTEDDYIDIGNPQTALLVIEVSDSTLRFDRGRKAALYAKHGITDYWIVNLVDRQIEVHRDPIPDPIHQFKFRYEQIEIHKPGESINPLAIKAAVTVDSLLPRAAQRAPTPKTRRKK